MTSYRLTLNLGLLSVGIASACSLTVPSEDEVFGNAGSGSSTGGSSGANGGSGNAATNGGEPQADAGSGGTIVAGGGNSMGGSGASAGVNGDAGAEADGGAGGAPPEPEPTGELVNPSFEESFKGWTVEPSTPALFICAAQFR